VAFRAIPSSEVTELICRLPLLTLFYSIKTAHLGDLMRISVRLDRSHLQDPPAASETFQGATSPTSKGQQLDLLFDKTEETTPQGRSLPLKALDQYESSVESRSCCRSACRSALFGGTSCWMFTVFPFERQAARRPRTPHRPIGGIYPIS